MDSVSFLKGFGEAGENWKLSSFLLLIIFTVSVYGGLIFWSGAKNVWASLSALHYSTFLVIILVVSLAYLLRFLRWEIYLRRLDYNIPLGANFRIFFSSFALSFTPGKAGEAIKSYLLKKEYNVAATPTLAILFCERFTDLLAMAGLSATAFLTYPHGAWAVSGLFVFQLLLLAIIQKEKWVDFLFLSPLERLGLIKKWRERIHRFYRTTSALLNFRNLLLGTILALISWGLEGLCLSYLVYKLSSLAAPWTGVFIFATASILGALSMLPGSVGSFEGVMTAMLVFYGISSSQAVTSTLLIRLTTFWFGVGLGLFVLLLSWRKVR